MYISEKHLFSSRRQCLAHIHFNRNEVFTESQEVKVEAVNSRAQKQSYFSCLWLPFTFCLGGVVLDCDESACDVGSCVLILVN